MAGETLRAHNRTLAIGALERDILLADCIPDPDQYADFVNGRAKPKLLDVVVRTFTNEVDYYRHLEVATEGGIACADDELRNVHVIDRAQLDRSFRLPCPEGDLSARWVYVVNYLSLTIGQALEYLLDHPIRTEDAFRELSGWLGSFVLPPVKEAGTQRAAMIELRADMHDIDAIHTDAKALPS